MIARLLGLLSNERFASEMSAVTLVMIILHIYRATPMTPQCKANLKLSLSLKPYPSQFLGLSMTQVLNIT